jgi:hypothetical protein
MAEQHPSYPDRMGCGYSDILVDKLMLRFFDIINFDTKDIFVNNGLNKELLKLNG